MLVGKTLKTVEFYLSPSRPLIGVDLADFFSGGLSVLLAGELNAKHLEWTSG